MYWIFPLAFIAFDPNPEEIEETPILKFMQENYLNYCQLLSLQRQRCSQEIILVSWIRILKKKEK